MSYYYASNKGSTVNVLVNLHSGLGCPGASLPEWGPPSSVHNESGFALMREPNLSMPRIEVNGSNMKRGDVRKPYCAVCFKAGKSIDVYTNHFTKSSLDKNAVVVCPTILAAQCSYCKKTGHFKAVCPILKEKEKEKNNQHCNTGFAKQNLVLNGDFVPVHEVNLHKILQNIPEESENILEPAKKRGRKPKGGKLTLNSQKKNETVNSIANIILHLKCSINDLSEYNNKLHKMVKYPLEYDPSVPTDIYTYSNMDNATPFSIYEQDRYMNENTASSIVDQCMLQTPTSYLDSINYSRLHEHTEQNGIHPTLFTLSSKQAAPSWAQQGTMDSIPISPSFTPGNVPFGSLDEACNNIESHSYEDAILRDRRSGTEFYAKETNNQQSSGVFCAGSNSFELRSTELGSFPSLTSFVTENIPLREPVGGPEQKIFDFQERPSTLLRSSPPKVGDAEEQNHHSTLGFASQNLCCNHLDIPAYTDKVLFSSKNQHISMLGGTIATEVASDIAKAECDTTNIKDINAKLKRLKIHLYKNHNYEKKSACFWCTYDYDNPTCYIPKYEMDDKIYGYGSFCRPECAVAYLMKENIDDSMKFERYHLLNQIYSKVYDFKKNIKPAPNPYYLLEKFYGNLTIQEYRKLLKTEHMLLVIEKPLTRILPELHEDNEDILLNTYASGNSNHTVPNNTGVYKVKRSSDKAAGPSKSSIIKDIFT